MKDETAAARVAEMEGLYDALLAGAIAGEGLTRLKDYYENGTWLRDYERDERGEFPPELKRGVLSEDGLYNALCDWEEEHP